MSSTVLAIENQGPISNLPRLKMTAFFSANSVILTISPVQMPPGPTTQFKHKTSTALACYKISVLNLSEETLQ